MNIPDDGRDGAWRALPSTTAMKAEPSSPNPVAPSPFANTTTSTTRGSILTPTSGTTSDVLSPGVNGGSFQHPGMLYAGNMSGAWPTPQNPGYVYSNANASNGLPPLSHSTMPLYKPLDSSPRTHNTAAGTSSTCTNGTNGDNQPNTPSYQDRPAFPGPSHTSGLAQPSIAAQTPIGSQPPAPGYSAPSSQAVGQDGTGYRNASLSSPHYSHATSPHGTAFPSYSPSLSHHQSPTNHSPTTSLAPPIRGSGSIPDMVPPGGFNQGRSPYPVMPPVTTYVAYPPMPHAVMSNLGQPGAPLTMIHSHPSFGPYHGMHHQPHSYWIGPSHLPPQQERPFKCDQCPQSFNRNHDLKRHKRIHLSVKPFPCNYCDKSFSRKDALKRHKLVKGCGDAVRPDDSDAGTQNTPMDTDGDRDDAGSDQTEASPGLVKREQYDFSVAPSKRDGHNHGRGPNSTY
ncbi:hypothetical protein QBC35DRAFT_385142 [Podospora australis]|uniref:C2H2-type domain-containing protein n=1 Tax=Podospora australis TaxID=1536484 RepID=A0AAN6WW34_9PEZI|nr:hypothetical protein QBC35DRAFT_385142 [Podospora australis]